MLVNEQKDSHFPYRITGTSQLVGGFSHEDRRSPLAIQQHFAEVHLINGSELPGSVSKNCFAHAVRENDASDF